MTGSATLAVKIAAFSVIYGTIRRSLSVKNRVKIRCFPLSIRSDGCECNYRYSLFFWPAAWSGLGYDLCSTCDVYGQLQIDRRDTLLREWEERKSLPVWSVNWSWCTFSFEEKQISFLASWYNHQAVERQSWKRLKSRTSVHFRISENFRWKKLIRSIEWYDACILCNKTFSSCSLWVQSKKYKNVDVTHVSVVSDVSLLDLLIGLIFVHNFYWLIFLLWI